MKLQRRNKKAKIIIMTATVVLLLMAFMQNTYAEPVIPGRVEINIDSADSPQETASSIKMLLLLTVLSLAPSILIMMTSFTRIIIILSFLRNALGTQQVPPNQVLIGLALFITFFVMNPVLTEINNTAFQPLTNGEITQQEAIDKSSMSIKKFMVNQIMINNREKDLALFISLSGADYPESREDAEKLPLNIVVPAFLVSELTTAFKIGFLIFIPFLVIDMIVSSTLMSMGMMMLPPVMISLPFKILLFIMVDGWNLTVQSIIKSFY